MEIFSIVFLLVIRIFVKMIRIVMATKLTLTVEKNIIEGAKLYAKSTGRSLSDLVEKYLLTLIKEETEERLSPKLSKIVGVVALPENFDEKKELEMYYANKHL